jgi:alkanesulfonate monooxygenase SsuD/methylene tetrahydromethanopterin reductase-like flavin-dependent oxidoreductase (luciferase family)
MTSTAIPLSVLDLVPITSGSTARQAIANTIDLAKRAEAAGYQRYWFAEHHLNPGVAGTTPALLIALIANATRTLRVGSGAVLMGHHTPLAVVEQFGILDAVHPGRIDLGLGRSGFKRLQERAGKPTASPTSTSSPTATAPHGRRTENGLLIPPPYSFAKLIGSPRAALQIGLLQQPKAETPDYAEQIDDILALIGGTYRGADGTEAHVIPGEDARLDIWILGSSGGESAEVAGRRGLPFAANYHVAPSSVVEAVEGYRAAFRPSATLTRPHVSVSADVVVGSTDQEARELATGYASWVRSIRSGEGAIKFPTPDEARSFEWSDDDQALVQDRLDTQFVGSPDRVADQLGILAEAVDADELLITTITHDQGDRVRSYELPADAWAARKQLARVG